MTLCIFQFPIVCGKYIEIQFISIYIDFVVQKLLNSLAYSISFSVDSIRLLHRWSWHRQIIKERLFSFPNMNAFNFFFLPNRPRLSSIMLTRNSKGRRLVLFLILGKYVQSFTIGYNSSCEFFLEAFYQVEEEFFS